MIRKILELLTNDWNQAIKNMEAIQRVRELHKPIETYFKPACEECSRIASMANGCETFINVELCETLKALDGEQ